jgi:hypothetical protein
VEISRGDPDRYRTAHARIDEALGGTGRSRHLRDGGQQPLRLGGKLTGLWGRLAGHLAAQPRISGERVHVTFLEAVEPQAEQ